MLAPCVVYVYFCVSVCLVILANMIYVFHFAVWRYLEHYNFTLKLYTTKKKQKVDNVQTFYFVHFNSTQPGI